MALTAAGDQCRNPASRGHDYCSSHRGVGHRPSKISRELIDVVAEQVEAGAYFESAAVAAGVNKTTLYRWRERGEADLEHGRDTLEALFCTALERAAAVAERTASLNVLRASLVDWRAAAWYLERRRPDRWGRRDHVEHTGSIRGAELELVTPPDEAAAQVARILAAAGALHDPEDPDDR
jgi:transposase-like protein